MELGLGYDELLAAMERPSLDAARMAVGRSLLKLAILAHRNQRLKARYAVRTSKYDGSTRSRFDCIDRPNSRQGQHAVAPSQPTSSRGAIASKRSA